MKKIAILTLRLNNNYGGLLQAYALNRYLRGLGHEAYTVDLKTAPAKFSRSRRALSYLWRFIKRLRGDKSIYYLDIQKQRNVFNMPGIHQVRFIERYIPTVPATLPLTREFQLRHKFDAYVVGSDQVWRPAFALNIKNYFLDFVAGEPVTRLSYAASFGTGSLQVGLTEKAEISALLDQFDGISVREREGVEICAGLTRKTAEHHVDPTLLLTRKQYTELLAKYGKSSNGKPHLVVYMLDHTKNKEQIVEHTAAMLGLTPKYVGKLHKGIFPSVESWLAGFRDASFVITDSFHGTVFSIIFNKPFLAVGNPGRGMGRFVSLLSGLGLQERLISNYEDLLKFDQEKLKAIDFTDANTTLTAEREKAAAFFTSHL